MYFYLAQNGRFYQNIRKTAAYDNAQIKIIACFDVDSNLVIYEIRRHSGTELSVLLNAIQNIVDYAVRCKCIGTNKVIVECKKIPDCYLHKIGFETINGCTFLDIIG